MRTAAGALLLTIAVACGSSSSDAPDAAPPGAAVSAPSNVTYVPVEGADPRTVIPVGKVTAEVYAVHAPPRLSAIIDKLQTNPEAFQAQVAKAAPGEPLPYDPSLGITSAEYDEMLLLTRQLLPTKVRDGSFTVSRDGSRFSFNGGPGLSDLDVSPSTSNPTP